MPFDAGMFRACVNEINEVASGSRTDKIFQPEREEVVFLLHTRSGSRRLSLKATSNSPRFSITGISKENPEKAPMFCMLLRKHLSGARFIGANVPGFERIAEFTFESRDELGFVGNKYIVMEIMGTYSNIILLDGSRIILGALKTVDITDVHKRAVLAGLPYQSPPPVDKTDPMSVSEAVFREFCDSCPEMPSDKFLVSKFSGISPIIAREISFLSSKSTDCPVSSADPDRFWFHFSRMVEMIRECDFHPVMISSHDGRPVDYTFTDVRQYENGAVVKEFGSFCDLIDDFFSAKEHAEHIRQRSTDILRILTNAETRLKKKIARQSAELDACSDAEKYKKYGDLVIANIYVLKKGIGEAELTDYSEENCPKVRVKLDERFTPQENAQRFYRKYSKLKTAKTELTKQIRSAELELEYIDTVFDSLSRASGESDLAEIRAELRGSVLSSKMKRTKSDQKIKNAPLEYTSTNGYRILCGKNNIQNEFLTFKTASRGDYWFHVKNSPGSHVILCCDGDEPPAEDLTDAAVIAAYNSRQRDGQNVPVDYTRVKHIKKPSGSNPGFVTYSTNFTAYVTPTAERTDELKTR
ncbi:MAG: NFACT family protein [Clostridia bacterium]|nr:NFACT family protein [Clostridia bacterium]